MSDDKYPIPSDLKETHAIISQIPADARSNLAAGVVELIERVAHLEAENEKLIGRREHTWKWCTSHYGKLEDWAREQLPEPFRTEFFNCVANGVWSASLDNSPPYICNAGFVIRPSGYFHMKTAEEQLLFDQWKRAEDAEAQVAALTAKVARLSAPVSDEETFEILGDDRLPGDATFRIAAQGFANRIITARAEEKVEP